MRRFTEIHCILNANLPTEFIYSGADKSLARLERKQASVSVRMA